MASKKLKIEVAYVSPNRECLLAFELEVERECSIEYAIYYSGILKLFPEIDLTKQRIGIFSRLKQLSDTVNDGDRIEIYRPLLIDPKEARRNKAKKMC